MQRTLGVILCLAGLASAVSAQTLDKAKLRQAIEMPSINTSLGVSFKSSERDRDGSKLDPAQRIAELQRKLTGSAEDGEILLEQRAVYRELLKDEIRAKEAVVKAEALLRPVAGTSDPKQGHLVTAYATTVELLKDEPWTDCEKWARRAVSVSPNDWRTWTYLAHIKHYQIPIIIVGGDEKLLPKENRAQEVLGMLYLKRARSENVDAAEKALDEALQCHDKAKDLAPKEPKRQVQRYGFRLAELLLRNEIAIYRGQKPALSKKQIERLMLDELQATAELHADHLLWQSQLAHQLIMLGWHESRDKDGKLPTTFRAARAEDEQAIRTALARIEKLADMGKGETTVYCLSMLSALHAALQDYSALEKHARRILQLDPKNQLASEQLQQALFLQKKFADQLSAAQTMIKDLPTARNQYLFAKALSLNQRFDLAEHACSAGLKLDGAEPHCLLGVAALLLRRADDAKSLEDVRKILDAASNAIRPELGANLHVELDYLAAIHQLLSGDVVFARIRLQRMQIENPDNPRYQKALAAIGS